MACSITLDIITVIAADGDGNPTALQIQGSVIGDCQQLFLQINDGIGILTTVTSGSFEVEMVLGQHYQSDDLKCDQDNDAQLSIQCLSGDSCQMMQRIGQLDCPTCTLEFALSPVQAVAGTLTETPTQVTLRGTVSGCEGVQARFTYSNADPGRTDWRNATIVDGQWEVTFYYSPTAGGAKDYSKDVQCGQDVIVEARCIDSDDCFISGTFPLICQTEQDCPGTTLTAVIDRECRSNRRLVHFTVTLTGVTDDTAISGYIATDDSSIGVEGTVSVQYSSETSDQWTANGNSRQRTYEYTFPPGTYTPTLELEGACAVSTPLTTITDVEGNSVDMLLIEACECVEATIAVTVCRVTDPNLTCDDDIPEDACEAVPDEELTEPLSPGVYVVTAVTTPADAGSISWSQNGTPISSASGSTYCLTLANDDNFEINAAVNLGLNCGIPADGVTLIGEPGDNGSDDDDDDGGGGGNGGDDGTNGNGDNGDGCLIDWCRLWLLINIGLAFFAGAAIVITACFLFNPAGLTSAFWVGVGISVALVLASIVSFIIWGFVCGRFRRMCGPLVWVHDILLLLSAASGIIGLLLLGALPCAIGFFLDFAYFGVLAAITEAIIRITGCPLGQNGIIGIILVVVNWISDALGLNSGN